MNFAECYVTELNEVLRQHSHIIRKDHSLAKKYQKYLTEIDNAKSILNAQNSEKNDLLFKLKTSSNATDILSQMINETDLKIDRMKGEIETLTEKIGRISNDITTMQCSTSNPDKLKILHRHLGMVLLNALKYSKEIRDIQIGFDALAGVRIKNFYDEQWTQFRTHNLNE